MSVRKPTREGSHANARTPPPRIRREIEVVPPSVSNAALARRYGIPRHTVAKWRKRASTEDASARPHRCPPWAPMSCRRSSRFWGLGCPKIFHEIEDSLV